MNRIEELRYLIKAVDKEGELIYGQMLKAHGITPSQYEILKILSFKDGCSISEIGDLLICGSDNPSRLVERLFTKKLVTKKKNEADTRITNIYITSSGCELLAKASTIEQQFNQQIEANLGADITVEQLKKVLTLQVRGTKTLEQIELRKKIQE